MTQPKYHNIIILMITIASSTRNAEAEFLRFIFAIMVFLSHMNVLPNGALAVDFFFLLTGFLTVLSLHKSIQKGITPKSTFDFILHKIKSFYPELLIATVISIIVYFVAKPISFSLLCDAAKTAINGIIPVLKMTGCGISVTDFNGATWYLSSMIIALLIVYPFFVRVSSHSLLFIIGILLCGFLCVYHGRLNGVYTFIGITYEGNIRAVGELLIGGAACRAVLMFSNFKLTLLASIIATAIKYIAFVVIIALSIVQSTRYHGVALCAALALIILVFSESTVDKGIYKNKICLFLGSISLPFYLSHRAITACSGSLMPWKNCSLWQESLICFIYSIIASLIVIVASSYIRKNYSRIIKKIIHKAAD